MERGNRRSEMKVVERREVVGAQQTMTEGRSTEVRVNGILQIDRPCCSSDHSWHVSSPKVARASR